MPPPTTTAGTTKTATATAWVGKAQSSVQGEVLAASEAYSLGEFVEGGVVSAEGCGRADGVSVAVSVYVSMAVWEG